MKREVIFTAGAIALDGGDRDQGTAAAELAHLEGPESGDYPAGVTTLDQAILSQAHGLDLWLG